jgi:hypothetical protein
MVKETLNSLKAEEIARLRALIELRAHYPRFCVVGKRASPMARIKSEGTVAYVATNQSRREALKRFGRYAAAAPTAMVLLQPREGHARKDNGRGWGKGGKSSKGGWGKSGKWAKGGGSHY